MDCLITSPTKTDRYSNIISVVVPGLSGQMQILSNHAEAFIVLGNGYIEIESSDGKLSKLEINGGECYVQKNLVTIIL